ncbi:MAG: response regulator [Candidatus Magnetominusculus sp. LBB02]|nr:response regulator [Candidatus Magnetominusculus sp. LBB02]
MQNAEDSGVLSMRHIRVLIVDDDKKIRRLYYLGVRNGSLFKRRSCEDGRCAIETYERFRPDIVVLDIVMPDMTGYEVLQHIRQQCGDTKTTIVMATSVADLDTINNCLRLGIQGYIVKPFNHREIADKVIEYYKASDPIRAELAQQYLEELRKP